MLYQFRGLRFDCVNINITELAYTMSISRFEIQFRQHEYSWIDIYHQHWDLGFNSPSLHIVRSGKKKKLKGFVCHPGEFG